MNVLRIWPSVAILAGALLPVSLLAAPVHDSQFATWYSLSAGYRTALGLSTDGTVWEWEHLTPREVADGSIVGPGARKVPELKAMEAVLAGAAGYGRGNHLALGQDGSVWFWGQPFIDGTISDYRYASDRPTRIPIEGRVISMAVGAYHYLALLDDGRVVAWGNNDYGQLGDGTFDPTGIPREVVGIETAVAISAGGYQSYAQLEDGSMMAWGRGGCGLLATYAERKNPLPIPVPSLEGMDAVSSAFRHALALSPDGHVYFWGRGVCGSLAYRWMAGGSPKRLIGIDEVVMVSAAWANAMVKADGTVWTWGDNRYGELGVGDMEVYLNPVQVEDLRGIVETSCRSAQCMALDAWGHAWAWGYWTRMEENKALIPVALPDPGVMDTYQAFSVSVSQEESGHWRERVNGTLAEFHSQPDIGAHRMAEQNSRGIFPFTSPPSKD